jgi:hypothetical protein
MVTRRERVVLELEDNFSRGIAQAAVATKAFERSLRDLDGTSTRSRGSMDGLDEVRQVSRSSREADRSINQLTGRLRLLTDVALTLGPALVPLGGGAIVAVAGLAAQFGALAGGIGVAIGALNGVGDALDALNEYQLEPSAENLAKVQEEFAKLGPAGADFVVFLESITPQLREMQMLAREGFLPGLADGIEDFLARGTQLNNIVSDLAEALGDLSARAGDALGGERFDAFFEYLDNEAGPLLTEFGNSLGYIAEGLANMMVAFAPATEDFSSGMESMTRSFAEWSRGLQDNDSFQEFLSYIRQNGPAAVDFLGSFVDALASVVEAAAPYGQAVLPILTKVLDVFASIAGTPIGSSLLTAAAAFVAFNRAASVVTPMVSKLGDALFLTDRAFQQTGNSATAAGGRIGTAFKFAGVVAGIMLVNEAVNTLGNSLESADLARNLEAWARGADVADFESVGYDIEVMASALRTAEEPLLELTSGFGLLGDTARDKAGKNIESLDQALASLVEGGNAEMAAAAFERLIAAAVERGVDADEAASQFDSYATALDNAGSEADETAVVHGELSGQLDTTTGSLDKMRNALQSARQDWKEQRQDARSVAETFFNLGESLNDAEKSLGEWLSEMEKNARALQEFQSNARKAAKNGLDEGLIKSLRDAGSEGALRMRQLANATDDEIERANRAWYKGQGAVKDFVKEVGGVKPKYITKLEAQIDEALAEIARLKRELNIPDEHVNVWVTRRTVNGGGMGPVPAGADGMTVPGPRRPYGDKVLAFIAPGEEVISNRYGQADRHRSLLKAINANRYADGGTAGGPRFGPNNPLSGIGRDFLSANELGVRLSNLTLRQLAAVGADMERLGKGPLAKLAKALEKASDLSEQELEASKRKLEALRDERDSIAATVEARLKTADLFGQGNSAQFTMSRPDNWAEMSEQAQASFLRAQWSIGQSLGYGQTQSPVAGDDPAPAEARPVWRRAPVRDRVRGWAGGRAGVVPPRAQAVRAVVRQARPRGRRCRRLGWQRCPGAGDSPADPRGA